MTYRAALITTNTEATSIHCIFLFIALFMSDDFDSSFLLKLNIWLISFHQVCITSVWMRLKTVIYIPALLPFLPSLSFAPEPFISTQFLCSPTLSFLHHWSVYATSTELTPVAWHDFQFAPRLLLTPPVLSVSNVSPFHLCLLSACLCHSSFKLPLWSVIIPTSHGCFCLIVSIFGFIYLFSPFWPLFLLAPSRSFISTLFLSAVIFPKSFRVYENHYLHFSGIPFYTHFCVCLCSLLGYQFPQSSCVLFFSLPCYIFYVFFCFFFFSIHLHC